MKKLVFLLIASGYSLAAHATPYPDTVVATVQVGTNPYLSTSLPNEEYVYVPNYLSDNVSVIRTDDHMVVATVAVGRYPHEAEALSSDEYVYVANRGSSDVSVIRTSDNAVTATIPVLGGPLFLATIRNGEYVYVFGDQGFSAIRTSDHTVVASVSTDQWVGYPFLSPDGEHVYAVEGTGLLWMFQTSNHIGAVVATVGDYPGQGGILPNGDYVYVPCRNDDLVSVIRTSDHTVVANVSVGDFPYHALVHPDGQYVYVSNWRSNTVSVMRTSDNTVVQTIPVGNGPRWMALLPSGDYLYTANVYSGNVTVIRLIDNTVVETIPAGGQYTHRPVVIRNGRLLYFPSENSNNVTVIGMSYVELVLDIKPGSFPNSINPRSKGKIAVAILTTSEFDAAQVDPATLAFGPGGAGVAHPMGHLEDVDGDLDLDLLVHFKTQQTGIACGDSSASIAGETFDGVPIEGEDSVVTVSCP